MASARRSGTGGIPRVLLLALMLVASLGVSAPQEAGARPRASATYENPITIRIPGSSRTVETFADPSVIKAKDGYYYAYATKDPRYDGDEFHVIPIIRSNDLVSWTYIGDVFPSNPATADPAAGIFAPDIRYVDDTYYLYYSITDLAGPPGGDSAIGVATARNPAGPWTDRGIVVEPQPNLCCPGSWRATIDPALFVDEDGRKYLYFGSYFGGLFVRELTDNGLRSLPATETRVAIDNRYEAPFVVKRGEYYYMYVSATDCCRFELTGYSVFAGRSRSPLGPFVDREGVSFLESRVGGTPVLSMNGNRWVGPGHNAVLTDLSGQEYIFYHAIDRFDDHLRSSNGVLINKRPLLIDRLDYIDGWPTVNAGEWASDDPQPAPVTDGRIYDEFNRSALGREYRAYGGSWGLASGPGTGNRAFVRQSAVAAPLAVLVGKGSTGSAYRAEADARLVAGAAGSRYGLVTSFRNRVNHVAVWFQPAAGGLGGALVTDIRRGNRSSEVVTPLPANFDHTDFHNLAVEVDKGILRVEVTESRLEDPLAVQTRRFNSASLGGGRAGFATRSASADFDNLSVARLARPVTEAVPEYVRGALLERYSDEFDGNFDPENGWTWVRQPSPAEYSLTERPGYFRFRTQNADLHENSNNASVLIEDAPDGDFTVETRLDFRLPPDYTNRAFQQAGLVLYENDDSYIKLAHVGIFNTRQTEFGKEVPEPIVSGARYGNTVVGPPADVTYLRIVRTVNEDGGFEEYTAYTRQEGERWVRGGTWTHELGEDVKIGLVSMGDCCYYPGDRPDLRTPVNADFDYVRVYRP